MKHIPHVTLKANMDKPDFSLTGQSYDIKFQDGFVWFPKMYSKNDPMRGSGFYCDIKGLKLPHPPHMTVWYDYFDDHSVFQKAPEPTTGQVFCADARSPNPEDWDVLKFHSIRNH